MAAGPELTIVVPARNEAAIIAATLRRIAAYLDRLGRTYELVVGDSASDDGTAERVRAAAGPGVRVIREELPGKGRILSTCLRRARGRYVGFIDADLEIGESALGELVAALDGGADAAIATKDAGLDPRPLPRRLATRAVNAAVRGIFETRFSDHQAGCKMFRASFLESVLPRVESVGWLWDTEVLVLTTRAGGRVAERPVALERERRPSRVGLSGALRSFVELFRFRMRVTRHRVVVPPRPYREPAESPSPRA